MNAGNVEQTDVERQTAPRHLLELNNITKNYPGVVALDSVDFALRRGEVHVLFGENGAGKSTLISIVAGAQQPTSGQLTFNGAPVDIRSVHEARELGISAVFQEFSLVPQMTVEENMFLGAETAKRGLLQKPALHQRAEQILAELDFPLDPALKVQHLTRAEQQMVEIAKAFRSELSVLILDEPTASLTDHETDKLFDLIARLRARGVGIIYITHRMSEIARIGDRITVLRDGRYVDTVDAKQTTDDELVRLMTGRVIDEIFPEVKFAPSEVLLEIDGLSTADRGVTDVSLYARRGEIIGLAGLVGSGKSRVTQAIFGATQVSAGKITFKGEVTTGASVKHLIDRGMLYLPANRRDQGLMMMRSCRENISLAALSQAPFSNRWLLDQTAERDKTTEIAEQLNLTPLRIERAVDHFSGGNQQKVMLARSLTRTFDLIIFDEPTVGVDVGTRSAIYGFVRDLCEAGAAIVLVSSDLPEIIHLSHRAYVFYRGRIQAELEGPEITEENLLRNFFERQAA